MSKTAARFAGFLLCTLLAAPGCSLLGADDDDDNGGTDGSPMPQTGFHPSCQEPSTSASPTCQNFCTKLARCSVGLCAEQLSQADLCDSSVVEAMAASCMATCNDAALQEEDAATACFFENTCEAIFSNQVCDATASLDCGGLPTPSTTGNTETQGPVDSVGDSTGSTSCEYTNDGECDEPEGTGFCPEGSDTADCDGWGTTGGYGSSGGSTGYGSSTGFGSSGGSSSTGF